MVSNSNPKTPGLELEIKEMEVSPDAGLGADLMRAVMSKPSNVGKSVLTADSKIDGIVIGVFSGTSANGQALVHYPGIPDDEPVAAISTGHLGEQSQGRELALGFINGNPMSPIILGLIQNTTDAEPVTTTSEATKPDVDVNIDGEKLILSADREIVLKCGKSSITLTRAGKVIVKGAYVSNHSTGVNRIKGGSVQIN